MGKYDHALKSIVNANPKAIARLVIRLAKRQGITIPKGAIKAVVQLSTEFQGTDADADGLLLIELEDGRCFLLHIEFQSARDSTMPDRLIDYCLRARRKHGPLPILCCVIYLREDGHMEEPPARWPWFDEQSTMLFTYVCVKLWETPREEIQAEQQPALLPLTLLAKGPIDDILVKSMFEGLLANKLHDLIPVGQTIAAWLLKGVALERLKKEYYQMLEVFRDSPFFEWVAETVSEEARQQVEEANRRTLTRFREIVVALVTHEFPDLTSLAKQQVAQVDDQDRLQQLILQVSTTHDFQEMVHLLTNASGEGI